MIRHWLVSIASTDAAAWLWPLVVLVILSFWLIGLHGDLWLADRLFALQGGEWSLRSHWLTETILHRNARMASAIVWFGTTLVWLATLLRSSWRLWRKPLGHLALTIPLSTGLVWVLKSTSDVACPWDLARYGGTLAYHGLLETGANAAGRCFPAGHASAGYAWLALFFFLSAVRPQWRWIGLVIGLGLGLLFGINQQLRGAHFLSHDLFTATICWLVALGLYRIVLRRPVEESVA